MTAQPPVVTDDTDGAGPAGLRALAVAARARHRVPSLVLGVACPWAEPTIVAVGWADAEAQRPAEVGTAYRIGSITKTFTAATVLLLAEEGRLDLDEPVAAYLPGTSVGTARLRQLLAHCAGIEREAPVPMWATMQGPDRAGLLQALTHAAFVDRPGARWHYSNLGYAVLGQVVHAATGRPCEELITTRLLEPLKLSGTTWQRPDSAAVGYRLDPYVDIQHREPDMDQAAIGVAGQLWSSPADLLTWGRALLGHYPEVLPEQVVTAMHTPHVMVDRNAWTTGWGLGLILDRRDRGIQAGHTGAMPGFLSALSVDAATGAVAAVLTNVTRGITLTDLTDAILRDADASRPPVEPAPTGPTVACPAELQGVLGRWWAEAEEVVFTWREGTLHAHLAERPDTTDSAFEQTGSDRYRVTSGRFKGELLQVLRDGDQITRLVWATYPHTREPR